MYEFTKDCMINIKEIDDEHSKLFQMINEAVDMNNKLDDITGVSKSLIANLKEYAATHFAHEEAYMESINDRDTIRCIYRNIFTAIVISRGFIKRFRPIHFTCSNISFFTIDTNSGIKI